MGSIIDIYTERYHERVLIEHFKKFSEEFPVLSYVNTTTDEEVTVIRGKHESGDGNMSDTANLRQIIMSQFTTGIQQPHKVLISDVQYNATLGVPAITFAIPKYSFFGDTMIGLIKAVTPVSSITNCLSDVKVADDGFILLLDNKKTIIYPDNVTRLAGKAGNTYFPPALANNGIIRATVAGIDSIAAYTSIEETGWQLIVAIPYAEFISKADKTIYASSGILFLVLTISGVIFTLIANNITNPLRRFISLTNKIAKGNHSQITGVSSNDEIGVLAESFNSMLSELDTMQRSRDEHLEKLMRTNEHLKQSQAQLVQSEKMASLGQLVAGVAHEINTPVGIAYTLSSCHVKTTETIISAFRDKSLRKEQLEEYLAEAEKGNQLIFNNLHRTAELIQSFKMVSTDQMTQERRSFMVGEYLKGILLNLQPKLKQHQHKIEISCPKEITVDSYPGAFAQIITNLLMNSLIHAYGPGDKGRISIEAVAKNDEIVFKYSDDGKGISQEDIKRIFDPFYTTKRGAGGTGLGLHIVYNTVTRTLGGQIECKSAEGEGTAFVIRFPVKAESAA